MVVSGGKGRNLDDTGIGDAPGKTFIDLLTAAAVVYRLQRQQW